MRFIKKFENFFLAPDVESDEEDYLRNKRNSIMNPEPDSEDTELDSMPMGDEDTELDSMPMSHHDMPMDEMPEEEFEGEGEYEEDEENNFHNNHIMSFEAKNNSYKKAKSKSKPDFLDLDKDGDKKESMKKAAKDAKSKDVKSDKKGLTAAQKKLPAGLQKAILAKKK